MSNRTDAETGATMDVLFAGLLVSRFQDALDWYTRFFDRAPDVVAHDREVMWRVTEGGWLNVLEDAERAGRGVVSIAVPDLDVAVRELAARGIGTDGIEPIGDAGRKARAFDPDGNEVALIQVS